MFVRTGEFLRKVGIVIAGGAIGGALGLCIPLLFDRDVAGAMASAIFGSVALAGGVFLATLVARRQFD